MLQFLAIQRSSRAHRHFGYIGFTLLQLLQHNVQLGAASKFSLLSSHWFIYGVRQRFTIINLAQTVVNFRYFLDIVYTVTRKRRHTLFVNERHYALMVTRDVAHSVGEAYVTGRWIGGSLTNFKRLWRMYRRSLKHRKTSSLTRARVLLKNTLVGLTVLKSLPAAVFFNSAQASLWGSGETYALHIPAAGITDTDTCPPFLLYPVPGNDDAFGSILFANQLVAKTVLVAKMLNMVKNYQLFCAKLKEQTARFAKYKAKRLRKQRDRFKFKPRGRTRK